VTETAPTRNTETAPVGNTEPTPVGNTETAAVRNELPGTMSRSDSLKMALTNIKNAVTAAQQLFLSKRDTMTIVVPNIDYDNVNLSQLKESIKKVKGVKSVNMHYNASTARLEIAFKGKPTELWDNVPPLIRSRFKLIEALENKIILQHNKQ
jgi:hypothetical protein